MIVTGDHIITIAYYDIQWRWTGSRLLSSSTRRFVPNLFVTRPFVPGVS